MKVSCLIALALTACPKLCAAAIFTVSTTADSGPGSLRQAILDANAAAGADTLQFAIAGSGPHTIGVSGQALDPNGPLLIDGYSQAGAIQNTRDPQQGGLNSSLKIVIAPAISGAASSAFNLDSGEVILRGLVISGFGSAASVRLNGASAVARIEGCYLGTNAEGSGPFTPRSVHALFVQAGRLHVGGTLPEQRNLLSGHSNDVFRLTSAASANSTIEGNLFGTDASGSVAIGNGGAGIRVQALSVATAHHLRIGGTGVEARNVFAASAAPAIQLDCASQVDCLDGLLIHGNYIGTDVSGVIPMPNNSGCPLVGCGGSRVGGISITGLKLGMLNIGGNAPGAGNRIAFNHGAAIGWQVSAGDVTGSLQVEGNEMFSNGGPGIELGRNNVSAPNDPNDVDEGANRFQNTPVLEHAELHADGVMLTVTYHVDTAITSSDYPLRIDFYRSADGEEGSTYLGSDVYDAAAAQTSRIILLPMTPGTSRLPLVATATDAQAHTSMFSNIFGNDILANGFE